MPLHGPLVYHVPFWGYQFSFVFSFYGDRVISFEPIDLPRFKHILDLFANFPSGTSIRAKVFTVGICDFVTFFANE